MISGDIVASGPALAHPNLERPVMYLDGLKVAPLIRQIASGISAEQTVERWSRHAGRYQCQGIFEWLWRRSIVVPSASP